MTVLDSPVAVIFVQSWSNDLLGLVNVQGTQLSLSCELHCSAFLTQWLRYFMVVF